MLSWCEGESSAIGAIDVGSNAIRVAVAEIDRRGNHEIVAYRRVPVRLGAPVFADGCIDTATTDAAVRAFRRFSEMFDDHEVRWYRAVGTSALRNADNRKLVVRRVRKRSGIELEAIPGDEEAALVHTAVLREFPDDAPPRVIADLGGGSLEVSVLRKGKRKRSVVIPAGTVRLVHEYGVRGQFGRRVERAIRDDIAAALADSLGEPPKRLDCLAICGGNARALAGIAPGKSQRGVPTLDVDKLDERLRRMRKRDVRSRMKAYGIGKDRAEVIAVAAVVFSALAQWADKRRLAAPQVGLLDGLLCELAADVVDRRERLSA